MKNLKSLVAVSISTMFLAACGGGSSPSTPAAPAPTVQITLSAPKIFIGDTAQISWTSSNATTCAGVDGFAGIQPIGGTINFTPTVGGQFKYSLRCTGAGGSSDGIQRHQKHQGTRSRPSERQEVGGPGNKDFAGRAKVF